MPQEIGKGRYRYASDDGDHRSARLKERGPNYDARAQKVFPFHFQITTMEHRTTTRASSVRAGVLSGLFQVGF